MCRLSLDQSCDSPRGVGTRLAYALVQLPIECIACACSACLFQGWDYEQFGVDPTPYQARPLSPWGQRNISATLWASVTAGSLDPVQWFGFLPLWMRRHWRRQQELNMCDTHEYAHRTVTWHCPQLVSGACQHLWPNFLDSHSFELREIAPNCSRVLARRCGSDTPPRRAAAAVQRPCGTARAGARSGNAWAGDALWPGRAWSRVRNEPRPSAPADGNVCVCCIFSLS